MFICMQKINFITQFFFNILQRNSKLVILGNLGMPDHTHLKWNSNLKKPLMFICRQKIKFILHIFLEILQGYCILVVLGTLGMPGYTNPKWYYQIVDQSDTINLQKIFVFFCGQKINFTPSPPSCFSGYLAKICKILVLGTLDMPGCTHPKW